MTFKTIHDCRLDLVAHTKAVDTAYVVTAPEQREGINVPGYWTDNVDLMPCSAARVSFGNEDKTGNDKDKDVKLMKYLADHQHMTPFEYQHATFLIEVPLFIRSQIHRHRTFSYNEISRRYTDEDLGFWKPVAWRHQSKNNKQASDGEFLAPALDKDYELGCKIALQGYEILLKNGVAREIARAVLPQSLLTKFYMGGNLRSWAHFIELRRDEHAQYEVQVVAERIAQELRKLWPESCNALGV